MTEGHDMRHHDYCDAEIKLFQATDIDVDTQFDYISDRRNDKSGPAMVQKGDTLKLITLKYAMGPFVNSLIMFCYSS